MKNIKIETITGTAIPLRGDDIDTDRIIPARYLRCVTFNGLGDHVFEDDRKHDPNHPFDQEEYQSASILVVGKNFGCGSSREHAPQALSRWGIKGIIGESFAEIFFSNCQAMGIPCFTINHQEGHALMADLETNPQQTLTMDIKAGLIHFQNQKLVAQIPSGTQKSLVEGTWDATSVLLQAEEQIELVASGLPYLNGFS